MPFAGERGGGRQVALSSILYPVSPSALCRRLGSRSCDLPLPSANEHTPANALARSDSSSSRCAHHPSRHDRPQILVSTGVPCSIGRDGLGIKGASGILFSPLTDFKLLNRLAVVPPWLTAASARLHDHYDEVRAGLAVKYASAMPVICPRTLEDMFLSECDVLLSHTPIPNVPSVVVPPPLVVLARESTRPECYCKIG